METNTDNFDLIPVPLQIAAPTPASTPASTPETTRAHGPTPVVRAVPGPPGTPTIIWPESKPVAVKEIHENKTIVDDLTGFCSPVPSLVSKERLDRLESIRRVKEYNGYYSNDFNKNQNLAIEIALAESVAGVNLNPEPLDVYLNFMAEFHAKNWKNALKIYNETDNEARQFIDSELDTIPWRISSEYYYDGTLHWSNSWIKIGWWPEDDFELSPQLIKGSWLTSTVGSPRNISTKSFACVVWKGSEKKTLLCLMECSETTNVKLELQDGFLVPVAFAFVGAKDYAPFIDLARIEIGSLDQLPEHNLDLFRIRHKQVTCPDGSELIFFRGCTMGSTMRHEGTVSLSDDDFSSDDKELLSDNEELDCYYDDDS